MVPNSGVVRRHRQTQFLLQFDLVLPLARQPRRGIRMFEKRIVQGVPFLVIHAVENSEKPVLPPAQ